MRLQLPYEFGPPFAFTRANLWFGYGAAFYSFNLQTHEVNFEWLFATHIEAIKANGDRIVVETNNVDGGCSLWSFNKNEWVPLATNATYWILAPNRVVFQEGDFVVPHDFKTRGEARRGQLYSASDHRFVYKDGKNFKWHDGSLADSTWHDIADRDAPPQPPSKYMIAYTDRRWWLTWE